MPTISHSTIQPAAWTPSLHPPLLLVLETQQGGKQKQYLQEPEVL